MCLCLPGAAGGWACSPAVSVPLQRDWPSLCQPGALWLFWTTAPGSPCQHSQGQQVSRDWIGPKPLCVAFPAAPLKQPCSFPPCNKTLRCTSGCGLHLSWVAIGKRKGGTTWGSGRIVTAFGQWMQSCLIPTQSLQLPATLDPKRIPRSF